ATPAREPAEHRRVEAPGEVVGPVDAPLLALDIEQAQGQAAEAARRERDLLDVRGAPEECPAHRTARERLPFVAAAEGPTETAVGDRPGPDEEVEGAGAGAGRRRIDHRRPRLRVGGPRP